MDTIDNPSEESTMTTQSPPGFVEVDKATFYGVVGPQDVTPEYLPGPYLYATEYLTPRREVRGRRVGFLHPGNGLPEYRYYLPESAKTTSGGS